MHFLSTILPFGTAFVGVALVAAYFYFTRNFKHWKKKGIKEVKPLPFIGNLKDVVKGRKNMGMLAQDIYMKHKKEPYIGIFAFDAPVLMVHDLEFVKAILVKDFQYFTDRTAQPAESDPLPAKSLFGLRGDRWRHARSAISPTFTSGKMKRMYEHVSECGNLLVAVIEKEKIAGKPVAVYELATRFTSDVIATCAFGIQGNNLADPKAEFRTYLKKSFEFSVKRSILMVLAFFAPRLLQLSGMKATLPEVEKFIRDTITFTAKERERLKIKRNDLLDSLIQLKNRGIISDGDGDEDTQGSDNFKLEYEDICCHSFAFLMAGYETSATTISFILFELARNQEVQDKLRKEIKDSATNGAVSYEAVNGMKYLDMVFRETLRKYPPLPFIEREASQEYKLPGTNVILQKGCTIMIPLLGFQRDPEFYPNPNKFDPERFSEDNKTNIVNYTYMPFGEGPRNCIGMRFAQMQTKTAVANLILRYSVHPCVKTPEEIKFNPRNFLSQSKDKIELIFKPIS